MKTVPMPGECHPALTHLREAVLRALESGETRLNYAVAPRLDLARDPEPVAPSFRSVSMDVKRCAGLAPYTGRPFMYMWDAMIDEMGRAIATPARIEYLPPDIRNPATWPTR